MLPMMTWSGRPEVATFEFRRKLLGVSVCVMLKRSLCGLCCSVRSVKMGLCCCSSSVFLQQMQFGSLGFASSIGGAACGASLLGPSYCVPLVYGLTPWAKPGTRDWAVLGCHEATFGP